MADKRSPQSPTFRSQKRSKTFPLASNAEDINKLCRTSTTPIIEPSPTLEENLSNKHSRTENETSTPDEDEQGDTEQNHRGGPLGSKDPVKDHESPALAKPDTGESHRGIDDEASEHKDEDDASTSHKGESDGSSDAYVPINYDEEGSDLGSPTHSLDLDEELGRWTAPPEPHRPVNPYKKGKVLEIRKHKACRPFGADYPYYEGAREPAPERELRTTTLVELCLDRPASEGETAMDRQPQNLEILKEIRTGDEGGAQVVVCRLSPGQEEVVAKIYDPLYYGFAHRMWSDRPRDVTYEADMDYSREVAAYSELNDQLGGTDIPEYHGSWTFQVLLDYPGGQRTRNIRLILMEHIRGRPMTDLKPESFSESFGLELVRLMIEAEVRIQFAGVRHGDVSQRNVMVCLSGADEIERVALIDFNFGVVTRLDNFVSLFPDLERGPEPEKTPNPVDMWWDGALYGVAGEWLPKSWELRLRALQEWLYERYGKSEEYESPRVPLDWDEENLPRMWIPI